MLDKSKSVYKRVINVILVILLLLMVTSIIMSLTYLMTNKASVDKAFYYEFYSSIWIAITIGLMYVFINKSEKMFNKTDSHLKKCTEVLMLVIIISGVYGVGDELINGFLSGIFDLKFIIDLIFLATIGVLLTYVINNYKTFSFYDPNIKKSILVASVIVLILVISFLYGLIEFNFNLIKYMILDIINDDIDYKVFLLTFTVMLSTLLLPIIGIWVSIRNNYINKIYQYFIDKFNKPKNKVVTESPADYNFDPQTGERIKKDK